MTTASWLLMAVFAVTFVVAAALMMDSAKTMRSRGATIVAFELAGSAERSASILASWGPVGRAAAIKNVRLDSLFIVGYAGGLSVLLWSLGGPIGRALVGAVLVAAACDALENGQLLAILRHGATEARARRAASFARTKFALVAIALLWLVVAAVRAVT